jgi:peptidoglycan/LPS O-acetylase OafA/YrhL
MMNPPAATASPPPPPPLGRHIPALDGLRGLAILMVMIFHQTVMVPATAADRAVARGAGHLDSGVDLFFVLSGFLITGILVDARGSAGYFRNFFARRSLRIFPLYYAVLVVVLVVLPRFHVSKLAKWGVTGADQLWYWFYLSNWRIGRVGFHHGILDVSWSLAIEEQFYLLWPFVVAALGRRSLIKVCVGLIAGAFLARVGLILAGGPEMGVHTFTTSRMDTLGTGALIALLARGPGGLGPWIAPARWVAAGGLVVLIAGWTAGQAPGTLAGAIHRSAGYSALAAVFGGLLVLAVAAPPKSRLARGLTWQPLLTLGTYSYALYLFHYPILGLIRDLAYGPSRFPRLMGSPLPGQLVFYALATLPTLGLAWLSWHLYEQPFLKLKRFFVTARPVPAPVPAPEHGPRTSPARPAHATWPATAPAPEFRANQS